MNPFIDPQESKTLLANALLADGRNRIPKGGDGAPRLTAAWALAQLPDADAADRLLKLADGARGYERSNATESCLLLAEHLLAAGDRAGARRIYAHLQESRSEKAERYVKEAAARGLAASK